MKPCTLSHALRPELQADLYYGISARESLQQLPDESVQLVLTSPPYWGLRDYGSPPEVWGGDAGCGHEWDEGYCTKCGAWKGPLGLEPTPQQFVKNLVEIFQGVWRVLRKDGLLWLNLGDSYAGGGRAGKNPEYHKKHTMFGKTTDEAHVGKFGLPQGVPAGLKPKDLVGIPWRAALALQEDGWWLRAAPPWVKANCMPESCTDRPTTAHEYWFMLAKAPRYFYDMEGARKGHCSFSRDALRKAAGTEGERPLGDNFSKENRHREGVQTPLTRADRAALLNPGGRNRRTADWWFESMDILIAEQEDRLAYLREIRESKKGLLVSEDGIPEGILSPTLPYKGAHFAVMAPPMIEPIIKTGTSQAGCCSKCGAPWERDVEVIRVKDPIRHTGRAATGCEDRHDAEHDRMLRFSSTKGWKPGCSCEAEAVPCVVLDPFSGSGTTGMVAWQHGCSYIGLDVSGDYLDLAQARIRGEKAPQKEAPAPTGSALDLFSSCTTGRWVF